MGSEMCIRDRLLSAQVNTRSAISNINLQKEIADKNAYANLMLDPLNLPVAPKPYKTLITEYNLPRPLEDFDFGPEPIKGATATYTTPWTNLAGGILDSLASASNAPQRQNANFTNAFNVQYNPSVGFDMASQVSDWTGTFDNCTLKEMDPNNYWGNPSAFFDVFIKEGFAEFINAAPGNKLQQNFGVVTGQQYQISFEIFNYSSGGVNVYLGGGYANGSTITANGTYTFYRTAASGNNEFFFEAMSGTNANFKIRNIISIELNKNAIPERFVSVVTEDEYKKSIAVSYTHLTLPTKA